MNGITVKMINEIRGDMLQELEAARRVALRKQVVALDSKAARVMRIEKEMDEVREQMDFIVSDEWSKPDNEGIAIFEMDSFTYTKETT